MNPGRIRIIRCICLFLLLMTGFALPVPAPAEDACSAFCPSGGSAIVFRKFISGSVMTDSGMVPASEITIRVVCFGSCPDEVRIRAHWVCPGSQSRNTSFICGETDFEFTSPIHGTVVFNPDNTMISGSNFVPVPRPPCPRGFLIAYVVDDFGRPIRFDVLNGAVKLRVSGSASSELLGIPIPADPKWPTGAPLLLGSDGALIFDGGTGHYAELTSRVRQNFRSANQLGSTPPGGFATSFITLLTVDVRSNRPNLPTFVPFEFFNQDGRRIGTGTEFVCWTERRLDEIDPNLTFEEMGTRWGLASSGQAMKVPGRVISDTPGPVTLLGLIEVAEGPSAAPERTVIFPLSPVESPTPTRFVP
jgi:hypothetical protein